MVKGITQKHIAGILWDAETRSVEALSCKGKVLERTARRSMADFKSGMTWERKAYLPEQRQKRFLNSLGKSSTNPNAAPESTLLETLKLL